MLFVCWTLSCGFWGQTQVTGPGGEHTYSYFTFWESILDQELTNQGWLRSKARDPPVSCPPLVLGLQEHATVSSFSHVCWSHEHWLPALLTEPSPQSRGIIFRTVTLRNKCLCGPGLIRHRLALGKYKPGQPNLSFNLLLTFSILSCSIGETGQKKPTEDQKRPCYCIFLWLLWWQRWNPGSYKYKTSILVLSHITDIENRVPCEQVEKTQANQSRVQTCIKLLKTGLFIYKCMKLNTETLLKYYILQILIQ